MKIELFIFFYGLPAYTDDGIMKEIHARKCKEEDLCLF